jgi:hypothetical protein
VTAVDFTIALFCRVDDELWEAKKHPFLRYFAADKPNAAWMQSECEMA